MHSLFCPSTCDPKCYDDDNFSFSTPSRAQKTCSYIMQNKKKAAQRRNALCKELKISDTCKWSCGMCNDSIKDDEDFRFPTGNKFRSCEFISKNTNLREYRQEKYCDSTYEGMLGIYTRDACELSCGNF